MTEYAEAVWTIEDIISLRLSWTTEEAEDWLESNEGYIRDCMIQAGWEAILYLLPKEQKEVPE